MKVDRRGQVLDTAFEIVQEHGLEGLHARTVAARIGINHAAVHYYFPKREDLILAMCERLGRRLADDRAAALEGTDRLKGHFQQARTYCSPDSSFIAVWVACWEYSKQSLAVHAELVRQLREWMFTLGLETKKVRTLDAEALVALFLGVAIVSHLLGEDFDFRTKLKSVLKGL